MSLGRAGDEPEGEETRVEKYGSPDMNDPFTACTSEVPPVV